MINRVIFIAGHETTGGFQFFSVLYLSPPLRLAKIFDYLANSITWILLELSRHPEIQEKLRKEIQEKQRQVVSEGRTQSEFTPEDYDSLPYLNAVLKVDLSSFIPYDLT